MTMARCRSFAGVTRVAALAFALALCACATPPPRAPQLSDATLLSGTLLFGEPVPAARPAELLELDDAMRAFVARTTIGARTRVARMRRLLAGMVEDGLLNITYDARATRSARETFAQRSGNCLSFTNLFVALGREAGADVRFQLLDIPPSWESDGDTVMLQNHINAVVRGMSAGPFHRRDYVVDFNRTDARGRYPARVVSDDFAAALHHNNLAVDALAAGDTRAAFAQLAAALTRAPNASGAWVNLGVLYARGGHARAAEAAYQRALKAAPGDPSAMTNLARLYALGGDTERAAYYRQRVRFYQQRNPWHHFWRARQAHKKERANEALASLRRALELRPDEHRFHFLKGRIHQERGEVRAARKSFERAHRYAREEKLRARTARKLEALENS